MQQYMQLRTKSIRGQLNGTIPSTIEGQKQNLDSLIDTENLDLSRLVSFDSIQAGITKENISEILEIIIGEDFSHDTAGLVNAIHSYAEQPQKITAILPKLLKNDFIRGTVEKAIIAPIMLIISIVLLLIALSSVKKYQRRKSYAIKT